MGEIYNAIETAKSVKGQPSVIVLDTVKGQGIPFVEEMMMNHHIVIDKEKAKAVMADLEKKIFDLDPASELEIPAADDVV